MSKVKKDYQFLAALLGLSLDKKSKTIYGQKNGFPVIARDSSFKKTNRLVMIVSAKPTADGITLNDIRQFTSENPFASLELKPNQILMKYESMQDQEQMYKTLRQSVNALISLLQSKRFEPCCASCGQNVETSVYSITDSHLTDAYASICPACINRIKVDIAYEKQQKHENILGGIAGALLGSAIGAVLILLLAQLGRVSVILGFIMAVCTFKGYALLGRKMTKKGIVICTFMVLFMTYVSNNMYWAILVAVQLDINVFAAFRIVPYLLKEGVIDASVFRNNLFMLYACTIAGMVVEVWSAIKEGKVTKIGP